jgi:hypothetical protein
VRSYEQPDERRSSSSPLSCSKRLDGAGPGHGGTGVLDDTVNAVGGDLGAERRAVSYCDDSGFETLAGETG